MSNIHQELLDEPDLRRLLSSYTAATNNIPAW